MTSTATITTTGQTTQNSRNAGNSEVAFGRHIPNRSDSTPNRNLSDRPTAKPRDGSGSQPGDDNPGGGDGPGGEEPSDDEPPNNDPPGDEDDPDMQGNLADAIAALARNIKQQGDGGRTKVREPDPFDGTDPIKLRTFLVQLQLSFNDRPRAFSTDRRKVNLSI